MSAITKIIHYEWISFTRNTFQIALIGCIFFLGLYAIYYGQSEIEVQRQTIKDVLKIEENEFHQHQASFKEELTSVSQKQKLDIASNPAYAWYRHGYHAILHPHDYAALSIGQGDLHPYYYRLTGMSLYYQLFENEIANPVKLYVGNLDLSFILIYLFPLLIIAFCHDLFSKEREHGILPLLHIQPLSIRKITLIRLLFYFGIITGLALLISMIGLTTSGHIFYKTNGIAALFWMLNVILYSAFWFALVFFIVSFKMNSSFTAITAAGVWLLVLIVIPAVLNVVATTKYPVDTTSLAEITRRTGLKNENDKNEAKAVINEFFEHQPEFKGPDSLLNVNPLAKAYAAFTSLKDIHNKKDVDNYIKSIHQRNHWVAQFQWINPAVNMQEIFARIAKTDLDTYHEFHDAIIVFHKEIKDFYFKKLFFEQPLQFEDYKQLPSFDVTFNEEKRTTMILTNMSKIGSITVLFFVMGYMIMSTLKRSRLTKGISSLNSIFIISTSSKPTLQLKKVFSRTKNN